MYRNLMERYFDVSAKQPVSGGWGSALESLMKAHKLFTQKVLFQSHIMYHIMILHAVCIASYYIIDNRKITSENIENSPKWHILNTQLH